MKRYGVENCEEIVEARIKEYFARLAYYCKEESLMQRQWAKFLER